MNSEKLLALVSITVSLSFSFNACVAKEIKISSNNTTYSDADVQKLAATAIDMGVKEPVNLSSGNDVVTVSGSSAAKCTFKVDNDDTSRVQGVSCK